MIVRELGLGVREIIPRRFSDDRGFLAETWQRQRFLDLGIDVDWVQENHSFSKDRNVLRGLHLQVSPAVQAKLVRVVRGRIFDVAVDVRRDSPTLGKWISCVLSSESFNQLFIPVGFAHGFLTLEPSTEVLYKVSALYSPSCERSILWNDLDIAIDWPMGVGEKPIISDKDRLSQSLANFLLAAGV
jgi:dTDP-4-dehydrorhamnose 3,5-epimerase